MYIIHEHDLVFENVNEYKYAFPQVNVLLNERMNEHNIN